MACEIFKCNCKHEFQDIQYGKNMRVFNPIGKDHTSGYKCTVCGTIIRSSSKK